MKKALSILTFILVAAFLSIVLWYMVSAREPQPVPRGTLMAAPVPALRDGDLVTSVKEVR